MTMSEERMEEMLQELKASYHVPSETPREEMWSAISSRLDAPQAEVLDISIARRRRAFTASGAVGWAAAAAAVLLVGVGLGRMTAPEGGERAAPIATMQMTPTSMAFAAQDHMRRTESLLTMVRADARAGRIDPTTARWARGLLSQTRLLMDAQDDATPRMNDLLLDLELVLAQIVGVAETGSMDEGRARTELDLLLRSLNDGAVLPRIRAAFQVGLAET